MAASPLPGQVTGVDVTMTNATKGPVVVGDGSGDTYLGLHISVDSEGVLEIHREDAAGELHKIASARYWSWYVLTVQQ